MVYYIWLNIKSKKDDFMDLWSILGNLALDGDPRQPGFQAQGWYLIINLILPILMGALLIGPVKWIEKIFSPGRGGRG
jgi:hypothetical protein